MSVLQPLCRARKHVRTQRQNNANSSCAANAAQQRHSNGRKMAVFSRHASARHADAAFRRLRIIFSAIAVSIRRDYMIYFIFSQATRDDTPSGLY
jgi:hypothetical protein